jgi:predicted nucleic acid-binding Zn ribbon protein
VSPRWRPLDEDPGPRKIGESVDRVVPGARAFSQLLEQWPTIVGMSIAARFQPTALHGGTLVVSTDDGASIASVKWLEQDLLARVQEALGAGVVTGLRFVVRSP